MKAQTIHFTEEQFKVYERLDLDQLIEDMSALNDTVTDIDQVLRDQGIDTNEVYFD